MKKKITCTLILLSFCYLTFAQHRRGDIEFGINTGFNYTTVTNPSKIYPEFRKAFNFGVSTGFYFSDRLSLKVKAIYDQKGWNDGFLLNTVGPDFVTNFHVNYITVPVMISWHFAKKRNWYIHAGPYAGYLLSAQATRFGFDVKNYLHRADFGAAFGVGTKIKLTDKLNLFVENDEQLGLINSFKENSEPAAHNVRGSLNIGVNFMLD